MNPEMTDDDRGAGVAHLPAEVIVIASVMAFGLGARAPSGPPRDARR